MIDFSEKVAECLIASAWIKLETQVINTPEIYQITNPATPYAFFNGVYRTNIPAEPSDDVIRTVQAGYRYRHISFRTNMLLPTSKAGDTPARKPRGSRKE